MPGKTIPIRETIERTKGWYSMPIKKEQYAMKFTINPNAVNNLFLIKTPVKKGHSENKISMNGSKAISNFSQKKNPAIVRLRPNITPNKASKVPIIFFDLTVLLFFL